MGRTMRHSERLKIEIAQSSSSGALGRLGLGLLNKASQPVVGANGHVQLFLCGELYHQDQRRRALVEAGALTAEAGDSELILQVYLRDGAEGVAQLDGAFVIAIWDERTQRLCVINDRFGLYPHYYAHMGGAFCFAPEIKGVLCAPEVPRRLDMTAIAEYTRFQQLLGERTWIEDVHLLAPGSIITYTPQNDAFALTRYWDWDKVPPLSTISFDDAVDETIRLFQRAIDAMTQPPLRVGVYLSGGLDGRTILGFIDPKIPATTLTFGSGNCRDVVYARELARKAKRPQHWFPFENGNWVLEHAGMHLALTEGQHSWMHGHGISTLEHASSLIDVHLSGWDGGTTMGGRLDEFETDALYRHAPDEATLCERLYQGFCRVFTWPGLTDDEARALFSGMPAPQLADRARESFADVLSKTAHYPAPYRADYFYTLQHVRRSTQNMIVFQRSAFEVRCPFFDYELINFLYSLPEEYRATPDFHRAVITRRMPALARVPHEKNNQLPHSNRLVRLAYAAQQRAKRGINRITRPMIGPVFPDYPRLYADYENYLRGDLRGWAETILFDRRTTERGLFQPAAVQSLWERHQRGNEQWTIGKIAPFITIELVTRQLIDGDASTAC